MASFKTGHSQREQVLDVKVSADLKVGDLVKVADGSMSKATNLSDAQYIVAQSDTTMEYGHVPVENRDWKYSDKVAASTTAKKVAVFYIIDKNDIIV